MLPEEKHARIGIIQDEKKILLSLVRSANKRKVAAYKRYTKLQNRWLVMKDQYEALDREEKFLEHSMKINKQNIKSAKKTKKSKDPKAEALKAINALPPEIRAAVLAQFK